jgi:DNA polymerase III subunit gamma/tau
VLVSQKGRRVAYVSLYRKYRPQTFDDVVGQDHVTRTLRNALEEDRLSHAYLFTGPRGTGKTSTARILAKAINCELGPTPTPCGVCVQCVAIADGTSVDVIELDMASHGGVDDARELRDRALFAPASARRKVYILDEVHMASTAAFNALLKLIEEPPSHVMFAMATTDPQKVLPTIMSRVQRLDLRRVAAVEVAGLVRELCAEEGYSIEDGAVEAVVRAGDGSVRDTLSVLEQILAFAGTDVTTEAVAQTLGQTPAERVIETVDRLGDRDLAGLFAVVQGLLDEGHDLRRFTLDLVQHLRDLLVLMVAPDRPDLVDATDERRRRLQAQTALLPRETLLRAVDLLAGTVAEQRQGSPRLPLELALATLAVPGADGDLADLSDRVARLEAGAPAAAPPARSAPAPAPVATPAPRPTPPRATEPAPIRPSAPVPEPAPVREAALEPEPESAPGSRAAAAAPSEDSPAPASAPAPTRETEPASEPVAAADPGPATEPASAEEGPTPPTVSGRNDLDVLTAHWDGILELLKQGSRRHHAMIEPAIPVAAGRGILTLRYGQRHASFHAAQARTGELDRALREAILQACGMKVRIDISIEGDDDRRRPMPPSVTPDDARTPVLDDGPVGAASPPPRGREVGSAPTAAAEPDDEGAEVREAELGGDVPAVDVDALLASELDAHLVEEHGPPEEPR